MSFKSCSSSCISKRKFSKKWISITLVSINCSMNIFSMSVRRRNKFKYDVLSLSTCVKFPTCMVPWVKLFRKLFRMFPICVIISLASSSKWLNTAMVLPRMKTLKVCFLYTDKDILKVPMNKDVVAICRRLNCNKMKHTELVDMVYTWFFNCRNTNICHEGQKHKLWWLWMCLFLYEHQRLRIQRAKPFFHPKKGV